MQLHAYLLGLVASASTIKAQAMINWVFYEAGSDCSRNWHNEPTNEDYWTETNGFCLPMNTRSGEYDVVVSAVNTGLNTNNPAMYACPDRSCDLHNCVLMAADQWGGSGMGCQHMYNSPFWWIAGVSTPFKRDVEGNETVGVDGPGLGPRGDENEAAGVDGVGLGQRDDENETAGVEEVGLGPRDDLNETGETRTRATEFHA